MLNADQPEFGALAATCRARGIAVLDYGARAERLRLVARRPAADGQRLELTLDGRTHSVTTPLAGAFQAAFEELGGTVTSFVGVNKGDTDMTPVLSEVATGAPEAIYRRSLWYYNLVNSPATMINADDLENWTKGQWGLESNGGDWVSFHRDFGDDREENGVTYSNHGTSEAVMRNQFKAWSSYMQGS